MSVATWVHRGLPTEREAPVPVKHSRMYTVSAVLVLALVAGAVSGLVFGPARGARADIGQVRVDLHASRKGIYGTLDRITAQLKATETSLAVQKKGLVVATDAEQDTHTTTGNTTQLLTQTSATLTTIRQVVASLGPLQGLRSDADHVTRDVRTGVALARSTLGLAQQTLATGQQALTLASKTLGTLRDSLAVQRQQLAVARETLEQTTQINRKLPFPAVAPTAPAGR